MKNFQQAVPEPFKHYLVEFHGTRDYFECHEILEEYWKSVPHDPLANLWVALIQVAVGSYHHRRNNFSGAIKMFRTALSALRVDELLQLGIDGERFIPLIRQRLQTVEQHQPFADLSFPFDNPTLLQQCQQMCADRNLTWAAPSSDEPELVDRHLHRDRTAVVAARAEALAEREMQR